MAVGQQRGRKDGTKIAGAAGDEDFHKLWPHSLPFPAGKGKKAAQSKANYTSRERDVKLPVRQMKFEIHRVVARRGQINAAHHEIATQKIRRLAIHSHRPFRVKFVVE